MTRDPTTVLLVEDDEASRRLVRAILHLGGYRILEAEDNEGARRILKRTIPGVVLLDIRLKSSDGRDLAREIRADPEYDEVPLVAITAQALKGDEEHLLSTGFDYYVAKPIDTRYVRRLVDELAERGRSQTE